MQSQENSISKISISPQPLIDRLESR